MKTKKLLIALLAVTATLFTACKENIPERDDSPLDENAGCYIYDNTSDVLIKPADGGKFLMTIAGETDTVETKVFNVLVGRNYSEAADSFEMQVQTKAGAFSLDPMVRFDKGEVVDTIEVEVLLDFGNTSKLILTVPEEKASLYSASSKTINVEVDYTWLPAGKGTFISQWEGAEGVVAIEKAKEFNNAAGDSLYRLNSPYYIVAPDYCAEEGKHLKFYLDKDYQARNDLFPYCDGTSSTVQWVEDNNTGIAYVENYVGSYCSFMNVENAYYLTTLWILEGQGYYGPSTEVFIWTDGYPGELTNPSEGEGELAELEFTTGTKTEEVDSETELNIYTLNFVNGNVEMNLVLAGEALSGDFKIASEVETAGSALAGYYDGTEMQGCYVDLGVTKYYMSKGDVQVDVAEDGTTYTVTVDAESASGVEVKATFNGTFAAPSPAPSKIKSVKRINL